MRNIDSYEIEDFASDESFVDWCLLQDAASTAFWSAWVKSHPEKHATIEAARELVTLLNAIETEENEMNIENEIWEKINADISTEKGVRPFYTYRKWASIAAVCCLLVVSYIWVQEWSGRDAENIVVNNNWISYENTTGLVKTIYLPDDSEVALEPFSSLKYPVVFEGEERAVFLKGEAFFDVKRDTLKPFMVYANETITKVLGTSFVITAFEGEQTVEVEVRTGKVAVYANVVSGNEAEEKKQMIIQADEQILLPLPNKKLEVTPNQKVVFDKQKEDMRKTVATLPTVIKKVEDIVQFQFNDEPAQKVFEALEQAYGIDLVFDDKALLECTLTTKLNDVPLFQKLDIICTALNLKYVESDAVIFVTGDGC